MYSTIPVSYTHLDVYKRQAKYRYSKRKNTIEDIIEHGFDIEKNARWLEEFYTNGK